MQDEETTPTQGYQSLPRLDQGAKQLPGELKLIKECIKTRQTNKKNEIKEKKINGTRQLKGEKTKKSVYTTALQFRHVKKKNISTEKSLTYKGDMSLETF